MASFPVGSNGCSKRSQHLAGREAEALLLYLGVCRLRGLGFRHGGCGLESLEIDLGERWSRPRRWPLPSVPLLERQFGEALDALEHYYEGVRAFGTEGTRDHS